MSTRFDIMEDAHLDAMYEERYESYSYDLYMDDAEEFERNQLALDQDFEYDEDDWYYDADEYDDPA